MLLTREHQGGGLVSQAGSELLQGGLVPDPLHLLTAAASQRRHQAGQCLVRDAHFQGVLHIIAHTTTMGPAVRVTLFARTVAITISGILGVRIFCTPQPTP